MPFFFQDKLIRIVSYTSKVKADLLPLVKKKAI